MTQTDFGTIFRNRSARSVSVCPRPKARWVHPHETDLHPYIQEVLDFARRMETGTVVDFVLQNPHGSTASIFFDVECKEVPRGRIACRGSMITGFFAFPPQGRGGPTPPPARKTNRRDNVQTVRSCELPTERWKSTPEAPSELFQDWQRTQTQSSVMVRKGPRQPTDVRCCQGRNHRQRHT